MNVKPGCMAHIVRPWLDDSTLGLTVAVVRRASIGERITMKNGETSAATGIGDHRSWLVDASNLAFPCFVAEVCLKPWEDPGDDAVDEVLQRIGSPNKQERTA